ncbi:uncharacterized protein KD926_008234 [Aspergillus affinis]|uniref:uncharacterized protein n=1 Tax=Aspergillus affinis TaxID=1070780 RepID=UPI0022FE2E39|nr:uncharacterized protein KD926_008234 [Aspergillus affinis]KAI9040411.1 hypothetical protein KD926_008234 [Aspergillus affinis]
MAEESSNFFRGYVRIELRSLQFEYSHFGKRILNPTHFTVLQEKFETDGCAREEPRNFIAAVIADDLLEQIIAQSDLSLGTLKDDANLPWLTLPKDIQILCLFGKHRVEAAKRSLLPGDRWWSVALYSEDNLRRRICMYRDPEFAPGDVFRNWRHFELAGHNDASFWQSLISARSRKDINSLEQHYKGIMQSIDRLITFPGLWVNFCFTFIRRILQINCPNDTLLWHPCSAALKRLIPGKHRDLRHAIMSRFNPSGVDWPVQVAEGVIESMNTRVSHEHELHSQRSNSAWVQLWCFVIRHVENLTNTKLAGHKSPTTEAQVFRPTQRESNYRLGLLARRLGFESASIDSLCGNTSLQPSVKAYLQGRRPADIYDFPTHWESTASRNIIGHLNRLQERRDYTITIPPFAEQTAKALKRCGLPAFESHQKDRKSLFLPYIYSSDQPMGEFPSSFAIRRDVIFSFLGEDIVPVECSTSWMASSPVDFDIYPPGTPSNEGYNDPPAEVASDLQLQMNASVDLEETPSVQLQRGLHTDHEVIVCPPKAAGFEDETIAPLNQLTDMSHNRSANDILEAWFQSNNMSLAVFYLFKSRQYIKFALNDPNLDSSLKEFVLAVANDYSLADFRRGLLNWEEVIENIHQTNLLLVYKELEHEQLTNTNLREYVCSFDSQTGELIYEQRMHQQRIHQKRINQKQIHQEGNLEDQDSSTGRKRRGKRSSPEEPEIY